MAPPQLNRLVHLVTGTGSCTIDLSKDARCEAQAGRADLGICLIKAWSEGVQIGLSDSCEDGPELPGVVWSALALGAGWSDMKPDLPR